MSAAVALLMQYALLLPSEGGLGLRRVQYQTDANNERSIALARKYGFQQEGILRWHRVMPGEKSAWIRERQMASPGRKRGIRRSWQCVGTTGSRGSRKRSVDLATSCMQRRVAVS